MDIMGAVGGAGDEGCGGVGTPTGTTAEWTSAAAIAATAAATTATTETDIALKTDAAAVLECLQRSMADADDDDEDDFMLHSCCNLLIMATTSTNANAGSTTTTTTTTNDSSSNAICPPDHISREPVSTLPPVSELRPDFSTFYGDRPLRGVVHSSATDVAGVCLHESRTTATAANSQNWSTTRPSVQCTPAYSSQQSSATLITSRDLSSTFVGGSDFTTLTNASTSQSNSGTTSGQPAVYYKSTSSVRATPMDGELGAPHQPSAHQCHQYLVELGVGGGGGDDDASNPPDTGYGQMFDPAPLYAATAASASPYLSANGDYYRDTYSPSGQSQSTSCIPSDLQQVTPTIQELRAPTPAVVQLPPPPAPPSATVHVAPSGTARSSTSDAVGVTGLTVAPASAAAAGAAGAAMGPTDGYCHQRAPVGPAVPTTARIEASSSLALPSASSSTSSRTLPLASASSLRTLPSSSSSSSSSRTLPSSSASSSRTLPSSSASSRTLPLSSSSSSSSFSLTTTTSATLTTPQPGAAIATGAATAPPPPPGQRIGAEEYACKPPLAMIGKAAGPTVPERTPVSVAVAVAAAAGTIAIRTAAVTAGEEASAETTTSTSTGFGHTTAPSYHHHHHQHYHNVPLGAAPPLPPPPPQQAVQASHQDSPTLIYDGSAVTPSACSDAHFGAYYATSSAAASAEAATPLAAHHYQNQNSYSYSQKADLTAHAGPPPAYGYSHASSGGQDVANLVPPPPSSTSYHSSSYQSSRKLYAGVNPAHLHHAHDHHQHHHHHSHQQPSLLQPEQQQADDRRHHHHHYGHPRHQQELHQQHYEYHVHLQQQQQQLQTDVTDNQEDTIYQRADDQNQLQSMTGYGQVTAADIRAVASEAPGGVYGSSQQYEPPYENQQQQHHHHHHQQHQHQQQQQQQHHHDQHHHDVMAYPPHSNPPAIPGPEPELGKTGVLVGDSASHSTGGQYQESCVTVLLPPTRDASANLIVGDSGSGAGAGAGGGGANNASNSAAQMFHDALEYIAPEVVNENRDSLFNPIAALTDTLLENNFDMTVPPVYYDHNRQHQYQHHLHHHHYHPNHQEKPVVFETAASAAVAQSYGDADIGKPQEQRREVVRDKDATKRKDNNLLEIIKVYRCKACGFRSSDKLKALRHTIESHSRPRLNRQARFACGACHLHFATLDACSEHVGLKHPAMTTAILKDGKLFKQLLILPEKQQLQQQQQQQQQQQPQQQHPRTRQSITSNQSKAAAVRLDADGQAHKIAWKRKIDREQGQYVCELKGCSIRFRLEENHRYHLRCHLPDPSQLQKFLCPVGECGLVSKRWATMANHLWNSHRIDLELQACSRCDFKTYSLSNLEKVHKLVHSEEKQFICEQCQSRFRTIKQLRNHRFTQHSQKAQSAEYKRSKTVPCPHCRQEMLKKNLGAHIRQVHEGRVPERTCLHCDYKTSSISDLKTHLSSIHQDECAMYCCERCGFLTPDHNVYRKHVLQHSNDKPYKCADCSYTSIQATTYKAHLRKSHPERARELIIRCGHCPFESISASRLQQHISKKHRHLINNSSSSNSNNNNNSNNSNSSNLTHSSRTTSTKKDNTNCSTNSNNNNNNNNNNSNNIKSSRNNDKTANNVYGGAISGNKRANRKCNQDANNIKNRNGADNSSNSKGGKSNLAEKSG